ncbi:MAG: SDR family NAD(P)-dependent oxidoreductase [Hyphomonadaceae bacterium]
MQLQAGMAVLITGGASGIGLGLAQACVEAGLRVAIADVDEAALARARQSLSGDATMLAFDVADAAAWPAALQRAEAEIGAIALLCLNAGIGGVAGPLESVPLHSFRRAMDVNVFGALNGLAAWLPGAKAAGDERHVVITASMSALRPTAYAGAYNASKFAALGVAETLRAELAESAVGVSVLCPGVTRTDFMRNSVKRGDAPAHSGVAAVLDKGMDPIAVGRRTLDAVRKREFYVFTHGEWRDVVAARQADMLAAFGANADPDYHEDMAGLMAASAEARKGQSQ